MKREQIEALLGHPDDPNLAGVAARVYADSATWPAFERALYPQAEPTEEERRAIRRVVAEHCGESARRRQAWLENFVANRLNRISEGVREFALAAASGTPRADAPHAEAGESVTFVFVSEPSEDPDGRSAAWRAELTLPPDAAVDDLLPIAVSDGAGEPLAGGVFRVAGAALPVEKGRAEIPYGMFLSGLKDAHVELTDAAGRRTHGTLALF